MKDRSASISVLGVLLVGILLRLFFYVGYFGGDDMFYYSSAIEMARGEFVPEGSHWQARLGVIGPMAALFAIFGPSVIVGTIPMMFASAISLLAAYWLAMQATGNRTIALLSMLLLGCYPLELLMASHVFPGAGVGAAIALSLSFYWLGETRRNARREGATGKQSVSGRTANWPYLLAGMCLSVAYLHRVTAMFVVLAWVAWVLGVRRKVIAGDLIIAFCLVATVIGESLAFYLLTDSPLHRYRVLFSGATDTGDAVPIRPGGIWLGPLVALVTNQEYGLLPVYVVVAGVWAAVKRKKAVLPLVLFVAIAGGYTLWGTVKLDTLRPLRPWPRYMTLVSVPSVILVAWMLVSIKRDWLRYCTLGLLLLSFAAGLAIDDGAKEFRVGKQLAAYVQKHPQQTFVLHSHDYISLGAAVDFQYPPNVCVLGPKPYSYTRRIAPKNHCSRSIEQLKPGDAVFVRGFRNIAVDGLVAEDELDVPKKTLLVGIEGLLPFLSSVINRVRPGESILVYEKPATG